MKNPSPSPSGRLLSLDVLRGADLMMLVLFQPVIMRVLGHVAGVPAAETVMHWFSHEEWEGFLPWDLVMPLFLFMSGVALPFSYSHYAQAGAKGKFAKRLLRRLLILFVLGMVVQGNLLDLSWADWSFYDNTLQAIAVGYVITGCSVMMLPLKWQIVLGGLLLIIYAVPMTLCGDWTVEGNFAWRVDELLMSGHRGDPTYTWIWSSLTFGVTVLMGAVSGQIVRRRESSLKNAKTLFLVGAGCIAAGLLWSLQMPIIKHLWTSSMTLFSGGICMVLLALTYYVIDVRGHRSHWEWMQYYGMNSIVAYMLGEWFSFKDVVHQFTFGLEQYLGDYYDVVLQLGQVSIIFLILRLMYRRNIFVKI